MPLFGWGKGVKGLGLKFMLFIIYCVAVTIYRCSSIMQPLVVFLREDICVSSCYIQEEMQDYLSQLHNKPTIGM